MTKLTAGMRVAWNTCRCNAAVLTVLLIALIELFSHFYCSKRFFSHEVDQMLHTLSKPHWNKPVVMVGDSVGRGIFNGWNIGNRQIAMLACNQATEAAGQYFMVRRYLNKNIAPGAVIICDRNPFAGNLNQNLTENYVQRTFTQWSEIYDLMAATQNPVFTTKMIAYKLLPTMKYRLHIQNQLVGFSNSNIYSGISQGNSAGTSRYGIIDTISQAIEKNRTESISSYFVSKMSSDLRTLHVPLYYLPPPSQETHHDSQRSAEEAISMMHRLQKTNRELYIIDHSSTPINDYYFSDSVHLNEYGLDYFRPLIAGDIANILVAAKTRQNENFLNMINQGELVSPSRYFLHTKHLKPLHDIQISSTGEGIYMISTGKDPSIEFASLPDFRKTANDRVVVQITVISTVESTSKLYYSLAVGDTFAEERSIKQNITNGSNTLHFILPESFKNGRLRFDPATREGTFVLQECLVKIVAGTMVRTYSNL